MIGESKEEYVNQRGDASPLTSETADQGTAVEIIARVRRSWRNNQLLAIALLSISISLPLVAFLSVAFGFSLWWMLPIALLIYILLFYAFAKAGISEHETAKLLNDKHPELEESTELVLKQRSQLGFLERLQVRKISTVLTGLYATDPKLVAANPGTAKMKKAAGFSALGVLLAAGIYLTAPLFRTGTANELSHTSAEINKKPERILPAISSVAVKVQPPAYTRINDRTQQRLNIRAEEGSMLTWEFSTRGNPSSVALIFNDSSVITLESLNKKQGTWAAQKRLKTNGFYQVRIDEMLSEFYQLEIIPDKQPSIVVQTPRPSTIIEYGSAPRFLLGLVISDDYGVSATDIVATIASGNGEAVKFKEQKFSFNGFVPGSKQSKLNRAFNLPALGMQPGDELYFYVSAVDNNKQETRSDIFSVKLEDTATLFSMDGMMSGIDLKPEFFRSQRQIIIETEQLLRGRDTMSKQAFNDRCNNLGIDQKLLRLRYGKFLGEESETNIGEEGNTGHTDDGEKPKQGDEHDDDHDDKISAEDFNNAEKIIDRYAHKHDIAEDATFFDPQTKKDLKAVLAEMWDSELRLRTFKPSDALPYEYKALRLLKELQQKSREYVAKTNTKTTPLKPEKRLTGELDKIISQANSQTIQPGLKKDTVLRTALAMLDELDENTDLSERTKDIFEQTAGELSLRASADPALYLPAFEAIKRIIKNEASSSDIVATGKALQRIIQGSTRTPVSRQSTPDMKLSKEYFNNLNKSQRGK